MGSALYVSIKNPPAELDTMMNGKALAKAGETLDAAAESIGVPPINKLCNASWKAPEKGLPIFETYLQYVETHTASVPNAAEVAEDLKDVVRFIGEAHKLGTKWRLMLDY
jgi:hypothetical protein